MNTTKKIMSAIAAIVLIASVTMLTFSFKPANQEAKRAFVPQWYSLSSSGSLETNQIIDTDISSIPDSQDCNLNNLGDRCSVEIYFETTVPSTSALTGKSVSQILSLYDNSYVDRSTKIPD